MIRGSEDGTGSRRPLLGDAGIVTPPDSQRKGRCRNAAAFFCVEKSGKAERMWKTQRCAKASPFGATATTAASGGNREELLGQRPAGCKRQRSRRWEPQPGLWHCEAMTERASSSPESRRTAISCLFVRAMPSPCLRFPVSALALSGASRQLSQRESRRRSGCISLSISVNLWKMHGLDRDNL